MHYNQIDIVNYLQELGRFVQRQQSEIQDLQSSIKLLKAELKEVKSKPYTNIEKLEYKFDQLKVETLEGTLNIGLNPYNNEQIEEFSVNQGQSNVKQAKAYTQNNQDTIRNRILQYLDNEGNHRIHDVQKRTGAPLDEAYSDFMIQDVKKQLDSRILYYLNQTSSENWSCEEKSIESEDLIIEKIKQDIDGAFSAFIQHLPRDGKEEYQ